MQWFRNHIRSHIVARKASTGCLWLVAILMIGFFNPEALAESRTTNREVEDIARTRTINGEIKDTALFNGSFRFQEPLRFLLDNNQRIVATHYSQDRLFYRTPEGFFEELPMQLQLWDANAGANGNFLTFRMLNSFIKPSMMLLIQNGNQFYITVQTITAFEAFVPMTRVPVIIPTTRECGGLFAR